MTAGDLTDALGRLGHRRRVLMAALCAERDRRSGDGDHQLAAVWHAVAWELADILDREQAVIRAMEADCGPVIRPLTVDELAESTWDDDE